MAVVVPTGSPVKNNSVQSQPGGLPRLPTHASMGRQGDPSEAKSTFAAAPPNGPSTKFGAKLQWVRTVQAVDEREAIEKGTEQFRVSAT